MLQTHELEDLALLLIRGADTPEIWIDRWAVSYPIAHIIEVSKTQSTAQWQAHIQTVFAQIENRHTAVVAHSTGAAAFLAWLYRADINARKKICNLILAAPNPQDFADDAEHTFQRVRSPCRTALVVENHRVTEWAKQHAALWNARLLSAPQSDLSAPLNGWQWGMKLMQEMLLSE